ATLIVVVVLILREAWHRFGESADINAPLMLVIAVLGLAANAVSAVVLFRSRDENVNMKGAFLHMAADALGSVGAITAGSVIWLTGWTLADPVVSVFISVLILWGSWGLLAQTINILLEATPENIDYGEVETALLDIGHVVDVHDLHIWTITSGVPSLSAHVSLETSCSDSTHWQLCLKEAQTMLRERFGIMHSTLQFEPSDFERDGRWI
ncbi:MAG: cation transporter, partial [Candidatus Latescibacteria bacterium]|nr:cation transporter [Candidatus Latescibacterota bacterium]